MPNKHPRMKLSRDEELFLRHWMYDEVHFRNGQGPGKVLQLQHGVVAADLATLIAAAIPDPADQAAAGQGPRPSEEPVWPWSEADLRQRLSQAREILAARQSKADK